MNSQETRFDNADFPVIIVNKNGEITYCNKNCEKIFGLSKKELKGVMYGIPVMPNTEGSINLVISGKSYGKVKVRCFSIPKGYLIAYTHRPEDAGFVKESLKRKEL